MTEKENYIAFADESYISNSRYQSISIFSFPFCHYDFFSTEISNILFKSDVYEFKWEKLKQAKYKFCGEKIIKLIIDNLFTHKIRVDTIIWDLYDRRHRIVGRDDLANFERMFFHLVKKVMGIRNKGTIWQIRPDVRCGIKWDELNRCLQNTGKKRKIFETIFGEIITDPGFYIESFEEKQSHKEVPIQVCDLFAGLSVFSKVSFNKYSLWKNEQKPSLFCEATSLCLSNSEKYRSELLDKFNSNCKKLKLGVSLETERCLRTINPNNPINFWHYIPQGDYDRAPCKN